MKEKQPGPRQGKPLLQPHRPRVCSTPAGTANPGLLHRTLEAYWASLWVGRGEPRLESRSPNHAPSLPSWGGGGGQGLVLTDGSGSQEFHDHLGRLAAQVEGCTHILREAEANYGEGGGLYDNHAGPGEEEGGNGAKGLHQVGVLTPRLGDHCAKLCKAQGTWKTEEGTHPLRLRPVPQSLPPLGAHNLNRPVLATGP